MEKLFTSTFAIAKQLYAFNRKISLWSGKREIGKHKTQQHFVDVVGCAQLLHADEMKLSKFLRLLFPDYWSGRFSQFPDLTCDTNDNEIPFNCFVKKVAKVTKNFMMKIYKFSSHKSSSKFKSLFTMNVKINKMLHTNLNTQKESFESRKRPYVKGATWKCFHRVLNCLLSM